jgi:spore maturation protein CgeB
VLFHPAIASEPVVNILSSADIGISLIEQHSKSYELALPSKIFEYMLAGLPVISSPLKQVKDLFNNSEGMVFAHPDNSKELLEACHLAMRMSRDILLKTKIHIGAYNTYTFECDAETFRNFLTQHPMPN